MLIFLVFYDCGCQLVLCKIVGPWVASHGQQIGNQSSLQIKSTREHKGDCCTFSNYKTDAVSIYYVVKRNQFIRVVKN